MCAKHWDSSHGSGRQEAAEAIGVIFLMHGGPASVYDSRAYEAFCEFADGAESKAAQG